MQPYHYPQTDIFDANILPPIIETTTEDDADVPMETKFLAKLTSQMINCPFDREEKRFSQFMQNIDERKNYKAPKDAAKQLSLMKPLPSKSSNTPLKLPCAMWKNTENNLQPYPNVVFPGAPGYRCSIYSGLEGGGGGGGWSSDFSGYGSSSYGYGTSTSFETSTTSYGSSSSGVFQEDKQKYQKGIIPGQHLKHKDKDLRKKQRKEFKKISKMTDKHGKIDFKRKGKRYRFVERKKDKNEDVEKDSVEIAAITPIMKLPKQKNVDNDSF